MRCCDDGDRPWEKKLSSQDCMRSGRRLFFSTMEVWFIICESQYVLKCQNTAVTIKVEILERCTFREKLSNFVLTSTYLVWLLALGFEKMEPSQMITRVTCGLKRTWNRVVGRNKFFTLASLMDITE